jgi:hypothetical protein
MWRITGKNGNDYSYETKDPLGENQVKRHSLWGLSGYIANCVALASLSKWDLLISGLASILFEEIERRGLFGGPYFMDWAFGISFQTSWQDGYLIVNALMGRYNWLTLVAAGLALMGNIGAWWSDKLVSHWAHFLGTVFGAVTALILSQFGPKRNPVKFFAKHSLGIMLLIVGSTMLLVHGTKKTFPDPPGFEDPLDPEVVKVRKAKLQAEIAEMELRHAEDERKNRERDAANEVFFRTWAPKTRRV